MIILVQDFQSFTTRKYDLALVTAASFIALVLHYFFGLIVLLRICCLKPECSGPAVVARTVG